MLGCSGLLLESSRCLKSKELVCLEHNVQFSLMFSYIVCVCVCVCLWDLMHLHIYETVLYLGHIE